MNEKYPYHMILPSCDPPHWFVYIVECSDSSLYTGVTNNLKYRIEQHNKKKGAKYTKSRVPVSLVYYESHTDRSSAQQREYQLKQLPRSEKIKLIQ